MPGTDKMAIDQRFDYLLEHRRDTCKPVVRNAASC
jgi:hypothetical protein